MVSWILVVYLSSQFWVHPSFVNYVFITQILVLAPGSKGLA